MGSIAINAYEVGPPQGLLDAWDLVQECGPLCEGSMELVGVPELREPPFGGGASDTRAATLDVQVSHLIFLWSKTRCDRLPAGPLGSWWFFDATP